MEKRRVIISKFDKDYELKKRSIFLWNLESEKSLENDKIELIFVRDESLPKLEQIRMLEMDFGDHFIPMPLCIIPAALAFVIFTWLIKTRSSFSLTCFISLFPAQFYCF